MIGENLDLMERWGILSSEIRVILASKVTFEGGGEEDSLPVLGIKQYAAINSLLSILNSIYNPDKIDVYNQQNKKIDPNAEWDGSPVSFFYCFGKNQIRLTMSNGDVQRVSSNGDILDENGLSFQIRPMIIGGIKENTFTGVEILQIGDEVYLQFVNGNGNVIKEIPSIASQILEAPFLKDMSTQLWEQSKDINN